MRVNVLGALVVASFVVSGCSEVDAETTARDDVAYSNNKVVRLLRENTDVPEERMVTEFVDGMKDMVTSATAKGKSLWSKYYPRSKGPVDDIPPASDPVRAISKPEGSPVVPEPSNKNTINNVQIEDLHPASDPVPARSKPEGSPVVPEPSNKNTNKGVHVEDLDPNAPPEVTTIKQPQGEKVTIENGNSQPIHEPKQPLLETTLNGKGDKGKETPESSELLSEEEIFNRYFTRNDNTEKEGGKKSPTASGKPRGDGETPIGDNVHKQLGDEEAAAKTMKEFEEHYGNFKPDEKVRMEKAKIDVEKLVAHDKDEIARIIRLAINGGKKEKALWLKILIYVMYIAGAASFFAVAIMLLAKSSKSRPSPAGTP